MRKAHPNGVQGRRKVNRKKDLKRRDEISALQRWLKGEIKTK
ncbi:hypothetical protein LNA02_22230 [Levilactobacillus namurensis]|uniref:Uncharacterized protein n=1 Tax=Levilactobacillus namurensis TaxID=380393 RepID=A0AAW8W5L8_9LACO|nr:hypothetical protein [Levilactobacillus namurensis]MCW3778269.1 hypothetical protein [Levilactobacillus namurensis]MDT7013835.1 hypothetical protein [Levilactobacillus namurensis]MDT7019237.1 hypothetical protein [Levilactobacillus namurensis]WNN66160.1 hypothetical protein RIN67_03430 [Levilactobacillus namurensis]GEO75525.1 hypothetical protein LNA02_22230 [Levilactobacillus namurensis]